ncbi:hypothetical protein [Streptomyces sp. NPDC092370]|uniref:hypothetical protein n=1 Tax=Streptomyces sp. NPDC092370 TaxID=3366016 RepID=UPI0038089348
MTGSPRLHQLSHESCSTPSPSLTTDPSPSAETGTTAGGGTSGTTGGDGISTTGGASTGFDGGSLAATARAAWVSSSWRPRPWKWWVSRLSASPRA